MIYLSVVVPVYNEEENIYDLYLSITDALKGKIENYEIVLVNDGSKDRSSILLNEIARMDSNIRVIHFQKKPRANGSHLCRNKKFQRGVNYPYGCRFTDRSPGYLPADAIYR